MRKNLLALFILLFSTYIYSQNENPFKQFGYDILVASSSKGEFKEFHDQTDIVEIGSVLFNTKTHEIVKILNKDETTIDIPSATAAMSIDPLCEKYYWISPYAYVANNPLKFIDPDGRDYRIFYTDENGKEQSWVFNGTNQSQAPKNEFISNFLLAYDYNVTNKGGENMIAAVENHSITIGVEYEKYGGTSEYSEDRGMQLIKWDPYEGTKEDGGNGFSISPATTLDHETDHSLQQINKPSQHKTDSKRGTDSVYRTTEERRVITGSEKRTANANGEIPDGQMRGTHYGKSLRVTTPISNTSDQWKTYKIMGKYSYKKLGK